MVFNAYPWRGEGKGSVVMFSDGAARNCVTLIPLTSDDIRPKGEPAVTEKENEQG